ncbi:nitrogen regulation protein NR(II) [bacterium]
MDRNLYTYLLGINFFILSFAILAIYYYACRLRITLKRSEKLREFSEKFRLLFDSTSEGVFQSDLEGNILFMNRAGANILGFIDQDQLIKSGFKTVDIYTSPKERTYLLDRLMKNEGVNNRVVDVKRKDGKHVHLEFTAHALHDKEGKFYGVEGIFRDVTDRIHLEEEIKGYSVDLEKKVHEKTEEILTLELERIQLEKLAALGRMGASIVHEIRNPLSSIKMGLTTVMKRADLVEKDYRCLELAAGEVSNLERILRDLLDFSKPQSLQFKEQDVNKVLDTVLNQMDEDLKQSKISLQRELCQTLPFVRVDMDRLSQVFINIVLNAKQAMPEGGTLRVSTALDTAKRIISIDIADSGIGMNQETLEKIVNPFFSTREEGTGLGLTISEKIVDAHGGKIHIKSKLHQGTSISIELPVRPISKK